MKVLIACEMSGRVRDAFLKKGHTVLSCDLLPSETEGPHYQGDIVDILYDRWDMLIAFPPCTHTCVSGARWFKQKWEKGLIQEALKFFKMLHDAPVEHICLEQPVSIVATHITKPDQIIHPWMFGHPEQKKTCLWLKNLPPLVATNDVKHEMLLLPKRDRERIHHMPPSQNRSTERSRTYLGVAAAMAEQWDFL